MRILGTTERGLGRIVELNEFEMDSIFALRRVLNDWPRGNMPVTSCDTTDTVDVVDAFRFIHEIADAIEQSKAGKVQSGQSGKSVSIVRVISVEIGK